MSSNYTGNADNATLTIALPEDSDSPSAALFRVPYERLLDNDASLRAIITASVAPNYSVALSKLRRLTREGTSVTDTAESIGATQRGRDAPIVACKTAQAFGVSDWDAFTVQGVPASITSLITDAANDGTRILAIGTGGNRCTYSDDDGASWSAGGNIGATPKRLVWNDNESRFLVTHGTADVSFSADGTSWTGATLDSIEAVGGLAVLSNGDTVAIGSLGASAIKRSTDGGANFSTVGAIPNNAQADEGGTVAGANQPTVWHCARLNTGATLQISSSSDGATWTELASIDPPSGATFASRPRIMACQNTALLWIVAPLDNSQCALYASADAGVTWLPPQVLYSSPNVTVDSFAVAGGRLIGTVNDMIFASDGLALEY